MIVNFSFGSCANDQILYLKEGNLTYPYVQVGRGTYCGDMVFNDRLLTDVSIAKREFTMLDVIGRYTSIAKNIRVYSDLNHNMDAVYQGVIPNYWLSKNNQTFIESLGQVDGFEHKGMVRIGNDVWIGNDVTLLADITIGNGAVLAAGSVAATDIPPYAIYGGNPARLIRYRFSDEIISKLQKIAWWNFSTEKLIEIEEDMKGRVEDFVDKYYQQAVEEDDKINSLFEKNTVPIFLVFVDNETEWFTYINVISDFIESFSEGEAELIVAYSDADNPLLIEELNKLVKQLDEKIKIKVQKVNEKDERAAIKSCDYFILGRTVKNVQRSIYADMYSKRVISGCNRPIFLKKIISQVKKDSKKQ